MPATNQTALAANNPSASASSKSSLHPKTNTAAKKVLSAASASSKSSLHPKTNTTTKKVPSAVAIGAKKVQSSKKSSSHPQTNTGKRVANSSNNKKYKKSKHSELSNETSEFLRQVSQGKNAEVSPAAKEVFQRTVNLYRQGVTISPVQENNDQVSFSTSEDDDSNADSESHSSSSSCGSDEMTLDEAYIRDSRDIHGDIDSDIDLEVLDKVQDDWDFEEFSELQDGIGRDSTDSFKNDYVRKLKVQGGLHVHYSAAIQSMLQGDRMESKIFFLFITKSY